MEVGRGEVRRFGIGPRARRSAMRTADNLRAADIAAAALFKPSMGGWVVQIFPGGIRKRQQQDKDDQ